MQQWLNARCAKLLEALNNTPFTDDADEIKLNLIRAAMREASLVMFQRAAESSRKKIQQINNDSIASKVEEIHSSEIADVIDETEALLAAAEALQSTEAKPESSQPVNPAMNSAFGNIQNVSDENDNTVQEESATEKAAPKLQISSSVIRRSE